jgi:hypothetical protein
MNGSSAQGQHTTFTFLMANKRGKVDCRGVRYYAGSRLRDDDYLAGDNPGW